jgi:hypothetical protein
MNRGKVLPFALNFFNRTHGITKETAQSENRKTQAPETNAGKPAQETVALQIVNFRTR